MKKFPTVILLGVIALFAGGCIGATANLMYMLHGLKIDAEYEGLEGSRVAVVVVSDASSYGPDTLTNVVGQAMALRLAQQVDDITLIPQNVIENWKDTHGWDQVDFREIGKGVNAEKVLAIDIGSYSIHEGTTLFKGRSMLTTTVYDLEDNGNVVFAQGPAEFSFPKTHARPAMSTNEREFESVFIAKMVDYVTRNFYAYDKAEAVAEDATGIDFR